MIPLQDFMDNKERCPNCGNRIFLEYAGSGDGREGSFIKCTFCFSLFDFCKHSDAFIERK